MKYSAAELRALNATSRSRGTVGPRARVPRVVAAVAEPGERALDYGAGRDAVHADRLRREHSLDVTAHEVGENAGAAHDPDALGRTYDVAYASNVLNVQPSKAAVERVVRELRGATRRGGVAVVNYPSSPRRNSMTDAEIQAMLGRSFRRVERVDDQGVFLCMAGRPRRRPRSMALSGAALGACAVLVWLLAR